jgi:hypothetical protein
MLLEKNNGGVKMSSDPVMRCKDSQDCHKLNHICQIILRKDLGRIKELVKDSQFYCKNCGRAAHDKENLCNPSAI